MSDIQQTDGTEQVQPSGNPQQAAPQQAEPQIPAGKRLVDDAEYQRLSRHSEQYRGAAPLINRLVERGVQKPEDFDRVWDRSEKIDAFGLDLDALGKAFGKGEPEPQQPQPSQFNPDDIRSLVRESLGSEMKVHEHRKAYQTEAQLLERAAKDIAGESASPARLEAAKRLLMAEARGDSARLYDDNHPLASTEFQPHDEQSLQAVKQKVGAQFKELLGAEIRDAAKSGTPSPGQADTGGDGPATAGKQNRSFTEMSKEEKLEWVRKNYYSGGTPMSSQ